MNRRVTTRHLHTQSFTTRPRCGRNGKHEAPRELSAHRSSGIAAVQVESKVFGAARGGDGGGRWGLVGRSGGGGHCPRDDPRGEAGVVWLNGGPSGTEKLRSALCVPALTALWLISHNHLWRSHHAAPPAHEQPPVRAGPCKTNWVLQVLQTLLKSSSTAG